LQFSKINVAPFQSKKFTALSPPAAAFPWTRCDRASRRSA